MVAIWATARGPSAKSLLTFLPFFSLSLVRSSFTCPYAGQILRARYVRTYTLRKGPPPPPPRVPLLPQAVERFGENVAATRDRTRDSSINSKRVARPVPTRKSRSPTSTTCQPLLGTSILRPSVSRHCEQLAHFHSLHAVNQFSDV